MSGSWSRCSYQWGASSCNAGYGITTLWRHHVWWLKICHEIVIGATGYQTTPLLGTLQTLGTQSFFTMPLLGTLEQTQCLEPFSSPNSYRRSFTLHKTGKEETKLINTAGRWPDNAHYHCRQMTRQRSLSLQAHDQTTLIYTTRVINN